MPVPFSKHPSVDDFIEYAKKHDCEETDSLKEATTGLTIRCLTGKNGIADSILDDGEIMLPREVQGMCERLGIPDYYDQ